MMTRTHDAGHQAHQAALQGECLRLMERGEAAARAGKKAEARYFFQAVLNLVPDHPDALLWLAYLAGGGHASLVYLARVLQADPANQRARAAVVWAKDRARPQAATASGVSLPVRPSKQGRRHGGLMGLLVLALVSGLVTVAFTGGVLGLPLPTPTQARLLAAVVSLTPVPTETPTPVPSATPTPVPTVTPTAPPSPTASPLPTALLPEQTATETATPTPTPTEPPPTVIPTPIASAPPTLSPTPLPTVRVGDNFRWIDVNLTHQRLIAYEGDTPVRTVIVSTGLPRTPTVTGRFRIYVKYKTDHMSGPDYNLPNVPYVMYFYAGYGLHGTYWHQNFGQPMSHGCVNLPTPDAEWLFNWASVGTLVYIHY